MGTSVSRGTRLGADDQARECGLCRLCHHVARILTRGHRRYIPISPLAFTIQPYTDPHITTDNSGYPRNSLSAPHIPPDLDTQQFASIITTKAQRDTTVEEDFPCFAMLCVAELLRGNDVDVSAALVDGVDNVEIVYWDIPW